MNNMADRMQIEFGQVVGAHTLYDVLDGPSAYHQVIVLCEHYNIEIDNELEVKMAARKLKSFFNKADESTRYDISVWFN